VKRDAVAAEKKRLWDGISTEQLYELQEQFKHNPDFCVETNQRLFALSRVLFAHGLHEQANSVIELIDFVAQLTVEARHGTTSA
jgi:hypothetical protein